VLRHPKVLIGADSVDDAGVYLLADDLALVQTLDFFTPITDDPYAFGQIAAANALSDVYAMGATPITALNIIAFPEKGDLGLDVLGAILRGGHDKCAEAGVPILGGHSIDDKEPKYGLSVTGTAHPARLWRKDGAKPGDKIILTKPLGTGILATAVKAGKASAEDERRMIETASALNRRAKETAENFDVHAATDVTGFGLANHLLDVVRQSGVSAVVSVGALPVLPGVRGFIEEKIIPGGTKNNLAHAAEHLVSDQGISDTDRLVACDAQTSGGLLLFVPAAQADELAEQLAKAGTLAHAIIGDVVAADCPTLRLVP